MHFWSQVSDKASAGRHSVSGDGRSRDDGHRRSRRRKSKGNGRCSVSLQWLTSVPSSWHTGEWFPPLYLSVILEGVLFEFVQIFYVCVNLAGGARGGASDRFSAYSSLAAGNSHPLQQRGSGDAPAFPELTRCTCGSQPGWGAVDQRQTGEKLGNSNGRTKALTRDFTPFYYFLISYIIEPIK